MSDTAEHFASVKEVVFLPYALHDYDAYTASMQQRSWDALGIKLTGLHLFQDPAEAIASADGIVAGGGNSFRLVDALHKLNLIAPVQAAVSSGVPYWGASAGSNVACPTIRTTNDMPIVQLPSFDAFNLVPFQINPHYIDPPPPEEQVGETREVRLHEFLEENDVTVVGLREESWLIIRDDVAELHGSAGAVLFRRGQDVKELRPGADVSFLLNQQVRFDSPIPRDRRLE
jgi:dipeptidase E